jgi:tetratricopeptide (TPR) repeat protein
VAVAKRKKNRTREPDSAAETLERIEGRGDRLAEWIGENPTMILGVAGAVLAATAIYGLANFSSEKSLGEASSTLALAKADYRRAMGASPGAIDIAEPANPEIAKNTRNEYVERFREVAQEYDGTLTGSLALLEVGVLQSQLDDLEGAIATWNLAAGDVDSASPIRAILLERIAIGQEQLGDYESAAASHEKAAAIAAYPLRYLALSNAARCHAEAGNGDAALAAYERVTLESPELRLPEHTEFMLMELKAARAL